MKSIPRHFILLCILTLSFYKGYSQASNYGVNLAGLDFGQNSTTKTPILPGVAGKDYFIPTAAELNYYKSKGLLLVRLPFLWERIQPTLGGPLDSTYLSHIDAVVNNASSRGMSVILDMHNYCRYATGGVNVVIGASGGPTVANFQDAWTKIAAHYVKQPAVWGFDLMNEPHNLASVSWLTIAQSGINAIRTIDTTHVILVEGDNWSKGNTWTTYNNNLLSLTDPDSNIVFEAHQYFDSDQSGQYKNTTVTGNGGNSNTGVSYITPFVDWITSNNLKGIVGEFGVPNNNDLTNWNTMLTNFLNYIQSNCIGGTYWAGGPAWGNYVTSIEPTSSGDSPQMAVMSNYSSLPSGCSLSASNMSVAITSPGTKSSVSAGSSVVINANASVIGSATITQVNFYANDSLLGTSTNSPYSFTWNNVAAGTYTLRATATASTTQMSSSLGVSLFVAKPVYSATATPIIDGIADPLWSNYTSSSLNKVIIGTVSSPSYLSANWKATYDNTNLYVLVTVTDNKLVNDKQAVYNDDGIEIYVDMGNTKTLSYGSNQFQFTFRWNDPKVYVNNGSSVAGIVLAQSNQGVAPGCTNNCTATGYTMEVMIPWSTLGASMPAQGIFEGFEVMVNDDDTGTRNAKIAWTATTDNAWQEPSLFGTIIMETTPCTPTAATISAEGSTTFCKGSSVRMDANSNMSSYQWYNNNIAISGATNASYYGSLGGNYTVAITENNCVSSSSGITVSVDSTVTNAGPDQYITTTNTTLAANVPFINNVGTWTVTSGTATFTNANLYNTAVTGLSQGANVLTWTITSDSCGSSFSNVTINVGAAPTPSVITGVTVVNAGQTNVVYSFTPSNINDHKYWTVPAGATIVSATSDSTQITVNFGTSSGNISVTESNNYGSTTQTTSITTPISIPVSGSTYAVYPNPYQASAIIQVSSHSTEPVNVVVTDLKGVVVAVYSNKSVNTEIVVGENLSPGLYIVHIQNGTESGVLKLIKID